MLSVHWVKNEKGVLVACWQKEHPPMKGLVASIIPANYFAQSASEPKRQANSKQA